jgi:hypothetical protein
MPTRSALTRQELLALPAAIDIRTAGRALGIGERKSYGMAQRGEFPVRVLRLGSTYRVSTSDLLTYLGIEPQDAPAGRAS